MPKFLKFWRRKKYKVEGTDVVILDCSELPNEIKKAYFPILDGIILDFFKHKEEFNFSSVSILFNDSFKSSSDLMVWFNRLFLAKDRIIYKIFTKEGIVGVANEKAAQEGVYSVSINVDLVLYDLLLWMLNKYGKNIFPFSNNILSNKDDEVVNDKVVIRTIKSLIMLLPKCESFFASKVTKFLAHELTHIRHSIEHKEFFIARERALDRIEQAGKNLATAIEGARNYDMLKWYTFMRESLENFSYGLLYEGLARYAEKHPNKSLRKWEETYNEALEKTEYLKRIIIKIISLPEEDKPKESTIRDLCIQMRLLGEFLKSYMYEIGFHMVYTISFFPIYVFKLDRRQFFEVYEHTCGKFGANPVVSYNKGKGIIDIKTAILDLKRVYKKLR